MPGAEQAQHRLQDAHVRLARPSPHGPGDHGLVVMDDGDEPLLQVNQQQHGVLGGEQHPTNASPWSGTCPPGYPADGLPGRTADDLGRHVNERPGAYVSD